MYVDDFCLLLFFLMKFLSFEERPKFSTNESNEGKASSITSFCALEWDMEVDLCLGLGLGFSLGLATAVDVKLVLVLAAAVAAVAAPAPVVELANVTF